MTFLDKLAARPWALTLTGFVLTALIMRMDGALLV